MLGSLLFNISLNALLLQYDLNRLCSNILVCKYDEDNTFCVAPVTFHEAKYMLEQL